MDEFFAALMEKGAPPQNAQPPENCSTAHSLLDMELTGEESLKSPLPTRPAAPHSDESLAISGVQSQMLSLNQKVEGRENNVKEELEKMKTTLTETMNEKQTEYLGHIDAQMEYILTQFKATLSWRLKHHHTEVLQEISTLLAPVTASVACLREEVTRLQGELSHCSTSIKYLTEEISTKSQPTPTDMVNQSTSTVYQEMPHTVTFSRPRMESTARHTATGEKQTVPGVSTLPLNKSRDTGRSPIKLQFPTYGKLEDPPDPLQYLERCEDYLSLNPLTDEELMATLRNVLHGTARDWWDVARHKIHTWKEFQVQFRAAFLSEDYEDELAERIRTRVQGENESIRDFVYMYQSLCRRWKPKMEEENIVKLILKHINPTLASQLRSSRVATVDELVRLGQQLERDRDNQYQYDQKRQAAATSRPTESRPLTNEPTVRPRTPNYNQNRPPQPFCWRCKGNHLPAACPHGGSNRTSSPQGPSQPAARPSSVQNSPATLGSLTTSGTRREACAAASTSGRPLPVQLRVPVTLGPWQGAAILDTGSSYTLVNERVWSELQETIKPWERGPLYLADGQERQPLGWSEITITVQSQVIKLPCVILPAQSLAFPAVLGLDFISLSGLQFDVSEQRYWFKFNQKKHYQFLHESATPSNIPFHQFAFFSAVPPTQLMTTPLDLLQNAVTQAHLDEFGKRSLYCQLQENPAVCTDVLGCTEVLAHKIYLSHDLPIKQKPYRVSPAKLQVIKEQVDDMLKRNIIEPSSSPYAAPVVLVPKKSDPKPRFCVDYRKLNAATHTDSYPLPNIQEILESLAGAKIFTTLDLNSGYWQVKMDSDSCEKTAFVCPYGLFQFKVMPFGLKNAPATFQRLMEIVLGELRGNICFVYLDDIIIYSSSCSQHQHDIQKVLDKLREANLTVNMKKSQFFRTSLKFLGHVVSSDGVAVDTEKSQAVQDFPVPQNLKQLQRFLGMAGWYHRFVPDFSTLTEPLNALKRKGAKFVWTPTCHASFEKLKQHLTSPPILGHPDFNLPFVVYTDASDVGLGAVLAQQTGLGTEQVLAFASRTLNTAERNYSTTEQECLAVVWAIEKWRYYLEGRHFIVVTDHSSLIWVFKTQKPSTRLIRWALRLQEFSFTVEYRKGKYNTVPDALSRAPPETECPRVTCAAVLRSNRDTSSSLHITDEAIWKAQQEDSYAQDLYKEIMEKGELAEDQTTQYTVLEDKIYRVVKLPHKTIYQVYIPPSLRPQLLHHYHNDPLSGHFGRYKTYKRLQALVYWPRMSVDVRDYVQCCQTCQMYKPETRRPPGKLQQIQVSGPWEMLGVDLMGPFPRSSRGNTYLLVFVDYYSRWVEMFPLRKATAEIISQHLVKEIVTRWGVPTYLLSDQGPQFLSSVYEETCKRWNILQKKTSAYHPQTNLTERINRNIKALLASYVEDKHTSWDKLLPEFRFALNTAVHEPTGVTPAELNLGRTLKGPLDAELRPQLGNPDTAAYATAKQVNELREFAMDNLKRAKQKQKKQYDKGRRDGEFSERDRVWIRTHPLSKGDKSFTAKLAPRWKGPYRVVRRTGPVNFEVVTEDTGEDLRVVHFAQMKPCYPSAKEWERAQRQKVLEIFQDESDDEDFPGFPVSDLETISKEQHKK